MDKIQKNSSFFSGYRPLESDVIFLATTKNLFASKYAVGGSDPAGLEIQGICNGRNKPRKTVHSKATMQMDCLMKITLQFKESQKALIGFG